MTRLLTITLISLFLLSVSTRDLCATLGQSCGNTFEGQSACCSDYVCQWPSDAMPGSEGSCVPASASLHTTSRSVCASANQECGIPQEGQKECCQGFQCVWTQNLPGSPGLCKQIIGKSLCAAHNQACGISAEGQQECCDGYTCQFNPQLIGGAGVCKTQAEIDVLDRLVCAAKGQQCGSPWEGQKECCSGSSCVATSNALGAPGICKTNVGASLLCASNGADCGLEEEGQLNCCLGYNCQWNANSGLGAPGKCVPTKPLCAATGEACGLEFEGQKSCCEGRCVWKAGSAPGSPGKCAASTVATTTINFAYCAVENQSCGIEEEGQARCCEGYQCSFNSGMDGAPGVCVKEGKLLCAGNGESCGIPEEGGNTCCSGYRCTWAANGAIGAKGKCAAI